MLASRSQTFLPLQSLSDTIHARGIPDRSVILVFRRVYVVCQVFIHLYKFVDFNKPKLKLVWSASLFHRVSR